MVAEPQPGESFASWSDRMAVRNGCPPSMIAEALGLDVRASSEVRSLAYGVVVTPETCKAIGAATGVSSEIVRGMHLEMFDGSAVDLAGVRVGVRSQSAGQRAVSGCSSSVAGHARSAWRLRAERGRSGGSWAGPRFVPRIGCWTTSWLCCARPPV
ncbi:TniQ family protein [Nonomuraea sp. NPDC049480]|uniref:TniQ family protein n=1 Tax=Nonomuraea sp. NPDC049480 TaxID=3364353 RepID=UPI00379A1EDC